MSYPVKQSLATSFFVTMYATDGFTRLTGVTLGQVIVKAYYADGTSAVVTPTAWVEKSATDAPGVYLITLPSSAFPVVPGPALFSIFTTGSDKSYREFVIQQYITDDFAGHAIRAHRILEGKWTVDPGANTLTLYDADGATILNVYDLFGSDLITPTSSKIYKRVPRNAIP